MIRSIKGDLQDVPLILVGNKCDETENRELTQVNKCLNGIIYFDDNCMNRNDQNVRNGIIYNVHSQSGLRVWCDHRNRYTIFV